MTRAATLILITCTGIALFAGQPPKGKPPAAVRWHGRDYTPAERYLCYRAGTPPTIDGKSDDPAWADAPWTDEFQDIEGDRKPKPAFRTRAKMLWDDEYFYVAAELEEPNVWATLTEHDSVIFRDNDFEVFIDPDGDSHHYLEYEINALGADWDLALDKPYKDGGNADNSWEIPGLKKAVHVDGTINEPGDTDGGWTVEIAFPWRPLIERGRVKPKPADGDQWRVNFSRVEWQIDVAGGEYRKVEGRPEDNWVWSPQWAVNMHRPETWGYVQFTTAKPGEGAFREDPTAGARHLLHRVLYAQKGHRHRTGEWSGTLKELGLADLEPAPRLETEGGGFRAGLTVPADGGPVEVTIDQDARVTAAPKLDRR